jgi:tetratricopeptide (TPR) repeat protein
MNWKPNNFKTAVVLWLLGVSVAFAEPGDDFKSASQSYDAGKFAEAAAAYERIEPKTANLYYNLGNAYFREGKLGLAILDYDRARRLAPRDPDIVANLKFAEQRLSVDEVNAPPRPWQKTLRSIIESRSPTEWGMYELSALWLTALAIGMCIYVPRLRSGLLVIATVAFMGFAVCGFALGQIVISDQTAPAAVVVAGDTAARFAPIADSTTHFKLTEGTRVVVREDRGQWLLVERADGQQGWVKSDSVERVVPQA